MRTETLLKLYEFAINEEQHHIDAHQSRIVFYMGLLPALVAGISAGILQASEWYHFAALSIGPILIFVISRNAQDGTFRFYQRFLEAITVRAKIEQELGLTKQHSKQSNKNGNYWSSEPFIAARHIKSRTAYESSETFIKYNSDKGYQKLTVQLFRSFQYLSFIMLIGLLALALWKIL
jgi:hypothetical protein